MTTNKTKGPKLGSARSNQSAKYSKGQLRSPAEQAKGDVIVESHAASSTDQTKHLVKARDGRSLIIPTIRWAGDIAKASAVGQSMTAFEALWAKANVAKLARGVDARSAPNSAKAVADNAAKAKPVKGAAAKAAKAKATERKVAKATERASAKADRKYKALVKAADCNLREGTWTETMVKTILAHTSTHAAQAAMDSARGEFKGRKLDFKWAADVRNYIKFA